jgi:hypothetical protein
MTTDLNTQVHDSAAIEATEKKHPQVISILNDADLDAVNGGDFHDAVVRAALGYAFNGAMAQFDKGEPARSNPCGFLF